MAIANGRLFGKANCALYHRVSTHDQNSKLARRELRQAAAARGLRVTLEVEETGRMQTCAGRALRTTGTAAKHTSR